MRRLFSIFAFVGCILAWGKGEKPLRREQLTYYVSPLGSDENPGGEGMPFESFHRAQLQIRTLNKAGALPRNGVRIVICEGKYALTEPLVFTKLDSGQEGAPVEWVGDGDVTLHGGVEIPLTAFTPVMDKDMLERLPEMARPHVQQADLKVFEIKKTDIVGDAADGVSPFGEVFFRGLPMIPAGSRDDADGKPRRFRAMNCPEELDSEGEWFVDAATGVLYCWLPAIGEEEMATGSVIFSRMRETLIRLDGCSYLKFSSLEIGYTQGGGIHVRGDHNLLDRCRVENTGDYGIDVEGRANCVQDSVVGHTGSYGISLNGGDLKTLERGGNSVVNCLIRKSGRRPLSEAPGMKLDGVGNILTHCELRDFPRSAVVYSGNEHEISMNDIHHACLETEGAGALYTTRDWGSRGNVVRHNFIHDIGAMDGTDMGVCFDDCDSGDAIVGNVFSRIPNAVRIGGGRHNLVKNNIFLDCPVAVSMDARGRNLAGKADLEAKLIAVNYRQEPWSSRYPELADIMQDRPEWPLHNEASRNVIVGGTGFVMEESLRPLFDEKDNWFVEETGNPVLVDWRRMDFTMEGSQAIHTRVPSCEEIPFSRIGRYAIRVRAP